MISDEAAETVKCVLTRHFELDAIWVFGSEAAGTAREESDIDIALLTQPAPSIDILAKAKAELSDALGREVDLIDLRRASPILAYQVLKSGVLVVDRNPRRTVDFVASAPARREDVLITRREAERLLIQRICDG
jgi:uncharacterized protein